MKHKLYVRFDVGTGDPIVLLHGINGDGTQWTKILELLKDKYRVVVVDLLGHGKSPRPSTAAYSPQQHADALRVALEEIDAYKNLTVVGYSMGGAVALSYAALYPNDIEQLYLISTPFYLTADQMVASRYTGSMLLIKISDFGYRILEHILESGKHTDTILRKMDSSAAFHKSIGAYDNTLDKDVIKRNIEQMIHRFDFAGMLAKVSAPVTYYAGKKDVFIVQGQVYGLRQFSPYMHIERLGIIKMDHMLVQNLPKEMVSKISANYTKLLHIAGDVGSGPTIVLLHGIESSSNYWDALVPVLGKHRRVITIDLLGFGNSPKPDNIAYNLDDHIKWLHRTIVSLGLSRFSLAGHSLGSLIALAYTAAYPTEVSSLTMFSPVLMSKQTVPKKRILQGLQRYGYLQETSYLYAQAAEILGDKRLIKFAPTIRSIENTINKQDPHAYAKRAAHVPTTFVYGTHDQLVDPALIRSVAKHIKTAQILPLNGQNHNFPFFAPELIIPILLGKDKNAKYRLKKNSIIPPNFIAQFFKLAIPAILVKSALYIIGGLLLFSWLAPYILTFGVAGYALIWGYRTINGAFSLRNEGLSYIAYIFLGIGSIIMAYVLLHHPEFSLKIAIFTLCAMFILAGTARVIVALRWASSKSIKRSLLVTGLPMFFVGATALAGSINSIYVVVYTIAAYLLVKGFTYGWFAAVSSVLAYIRGFRPLRHPSS